MSNSQLSFEFAPTGGGVWTGANDALKTNLQGGLSITSTLARESIQNAIDAGDTNSNLPVEITFTVVSIKPSQIPNIESLRKVLIACGESNKEKKDVADFYKSAVFKIEHDQYIEIMKISDYNTVGLTGGEDDMKGNYFLLMKTEGGTEKMSGKGGSWGFGKGAYFNASSFSTFFVSSVYEKDQYVFLGRSNLSSHILDKIKYQGNGSYGKRGQIAIRKSTEIPSVFERSIQGTDIYILGFKFKNWEKEMVDAVLNFFWYPILKGSLKVEIGNLTINENNIDNLIRENYEEYQKDKKESQNPLPYYSAYIDKDSEVIPENLPTLGKVKLYILKKNKYPQKIALMRKPGMVIMKKPKSSLIDYAAVFICDNEEGDEILREMEGPRHDIWDVEYASNKPSFYEKTKEAEKELDLFLAKSIKNIAPEITSSSRIGDLENYLSLEGDEDSDEGESNSSGIASNSKSEVETATLIASLSDEKLRTRNEILKIKEIKREIKGREGGDSPIMGNGGGTGVGGGGTPDEEGTRKILIDGIKFRTFCSEQDDKIIHIVSLKGQIDRPFNIEIKAGTDDSLEPVEILSADDEKGEKLKVYKNMIKNLRLSDLGKSKLKVIFTNNERLALNVLAYEI